MHIEDIAALQKRISPEILGILRMHRKEAPVSVPLAGQIWGKAGSARRNAYCVIKGYFFVKEGIKDTGTVSILHSPAFNKDTGFHIIFILSLIILRNNTDIIAYPAFIQKKKFVSC